MNNYIQKIVEDFDFNLIQDKPSGTLWCKCNLGTNTETEYGDYYSWGELTTKNEYTKENYTYKGKPSKLSCGQDVATQILGNNYSIPTKKQWDELLKYTNKKWIKNYNGTGVNGMLFTGKNSNSIFIPAAGTRLDSSLNYVGSYGRVWSSSINVNSFENAWLLRFDSEYCGMFYSNRYSGQSVRPVFKK